MLNKTAYQTNLSVVESLKPSLLWQWFARISSIPHPSHHEEALANHILEWAKSRGLSARRDAVGNVIIKKSATSGMENRQSIALQAHLDMVPQANAGTDHDFHADAIMLRRNQDDERWLMATGTTLGADNGIGMASCLAVLEADDLAHPDIEVLLTMTEETGMVGVFGLQPGELTSGLMINTDTEEIGEVYVGCAGGIDANICLPVELANHTYSSALCLNIKGLKGGHSGLDIHKNRGNAIKIAARMLASVLPDFQGAFCMASIQGGTLRNAIPRESSVILVCDAAVRDELATALQSAFEIIKTEMMRAEPKLDCIISPSQLPQQAIGDEDTIRVIHLLNTLPSGMVRHSDIAKDTVETSLSFGVVNLDDEGLKASLLIRSLLESGKNAVCQNLDSLCILAGAQAEFTGSYVGWNPDEQSQITPLTNRLYADILGHEPKVKVIHAGLECGLIKQSYPDMDIVSIGPTIKNAHSPQEMVHIDSVETYWQLLVQILANAPVRA
ncbi:aminoacyl-histidine dipeptidase [Moraxella sp. Tifton1]|uniref:aminoacyl-histidine dipeptidase n=1 Tax=Moraxella oculi TaxID=2940516 RepID=UPI0020116947|nr:aminoacyl-histidine dipeptidase [Moraxella sp. Tifton1]MCL1624163.1 aminoacyl-histidine dipeptidase [Moraxella sp. Tifton1]